MMMNMKFFARFIQILSLVVFVWFSPYDRAIQRIRGNVILNSIIFQSIPVVLK